MKEILRLDRPSLEKITADRLNVFLQDLLTMNVNDAVGIALDAYIRWARVLKPEEIDEWIQPHLKKCKADYERLVFSNRRRFIMIIVLGDFLGNASLDRSHPRSALAGWREINKDEAEQLVQRIHLWLANLAINEAFDSITELILRWADQYNAQMAIEFAQSCGQIDADQYSDENITIFLRWCFQDDLELADAQLTWHNWADQIYAKNFQNMSGAKVLQSDGYWLNYKPSLWAGFDYLEAPITGLGGFHIKFNPQVYTALQARLFNGSIPFILKQKLPTSKRIMNKKLGSNAYDLYESDEINEVLLGLYNILNLAIDIEASHISIHPFQLVCMLKNGKERKYPPIILHNDLSYIEAFSLIMSRDLLAQKAFRIIAEENNKIEIKINYI